VIGAVVPSRRIRWLPRDGIAELFGDGFYGGEESGALSSVRVELVALAEGKNLFEVEVEVELPDGHGRMLHQIGGAEPELSKLADRRPCSLDLVGRTTAATGDERIRLGVRA
jgi:hypothetical protein